MKRVTRMSGHAFIMAYYKRRKLAGYSVFIERDVNGVTQGELVHSFPITKHMDWYTVVHLANILRDCINEKESNNV